MNRAFAQIEISTTDCVDVTDEAVPLAFLSAVDLKERQGATGPCGNKDLLPMSTAE